MSLIYFELNFVFMYVWCKITHKYFNAERLLCKIVGLLLPPTCNESTQREKHEQYLLIYSAANSFSIPGRSNVELVRNRKYQGGKEKENRNGGKWGNRKQERKERRERQIRRNILESMVIIQTLHYRHLLRRIFYIRQVYILEISGTICHAN